MNGTWRLKVLQVLLGLQEASSVMREIRRIRLLEKPSAWQEGILQPLLAEGLSRQIVI